MMIKLVPQLSPLQFEWRNNPEIFEYTRQNGILSHSDHERWLHKIANDQSIKMFGLENIDHVIVGCGGLTSISLIHGSAEFSLFIGPEYQNKGYGYQALAELLKYGFKHLRLHRIFGETFEGNSAMRMFQKIGFRHEGTLKESYFKNGKYIDSHMIGILESEAREKEWFNL